MSDFSYRGRGTDGELVKGTIAASSEDSAAESLIRRGITPLDIRVAAVGSSTAEFTLFQKKVKHDDLIVFSRQMYALTKAGIPLLSAIQGLAENTSNKVLAEVLFDLLEQLEKGRSLSSAMSTHDDVFPPLMTAIVHVGENTGNLEESFLQLSDYLQKEQETRKQVKAATRYPMFVSIALVVAMFILNIFVIPTFAGMFTRFNLELPLPTRIMIGTSDFFVSYWPAMLLVIGLSIVLVRRYIKTENGRERWGYFMVRMPIIGDIVMRSLLSRFGRSFGVMLRSGVPLTQALSLVAEAVDNPWMGRKIIDMRRTIERGDSLTRSSKASNLFTPLVLQMIAVGEETGRVDELLHEVADYYEREVDYDLKSLTAKIEPLMLIVVAVVVAVIALGIFMPMWDMMNAYN